MMEMKKTIAALAITCSLALGSQSVLAEAAGSYTYYQVKKRRYAVENRQTISYNGGFTKIAEQFKNGYDPHWREIESPGGCEASRLGISRQKGDFAHRRRPKAACSARAGGDRLARAVCRQGGSGACRFKPYNAPRVSKDGARRHLSKNEIRLCVCAGENGEIDPHSADQARLRGGRQGAGLIPKRPPWLALFLQSENHKRQVDVIASGDDSHRAPCLCEVNRAGTGSVSFWTYGSIRQSPPPSRGNYPKRAGCWSRLGQNGKPLTSCKRRCDSRKAVYGCDAADGALPRPFDDSDCRQRVGG